MSWYKRGTAPHHSTVSYDRERTLPANTNVDSIAFAVYRPPARHPVFLSDKSETRWPIELKFVSRNSMPLLPRRRADGATHIWLHVVSCQFHIFDIGDKIRRDTVSVDGPHRPDREIDTKLPFCVVPWWCTWKQYRIISPCLSNKRLNVDSTYLVPLPVWMSFSSSSIFSLDLACASRNNCRS